MSLTLKKCASWQNSELNSTKTAYIEDSSIQPRDKEKALECSFTKTDGHMKVNGSKIVDTAEDLKSLEMETRSMGRMRMAKLMVRECTSGNMERSTMASG